MERLDHFVVHIDHNPEGLTALKREIEPVGFPFEPKWGKGTSGFRVANIWIGEQYFELVWLTKPDGGGWRKEWVHRYTGHRRGIFGLFLLTDELDRIRSDLARRHVATPVPERISFRALFGLWKKTMPWRTLYTPPIPGTNLQICYGELDSPRVMERMRSYMVPNSRDNGIAQIEEAVVRSIFLGRRVGAHPTTLPGGITGRSAHRS